jgi:1-deoxy-D-xylulose-5-phosphate synthase
MFRFALTLDTPAAIRYPRAVVPDADLSPDSPIELGRSVVVADGADGTIFAYGSMVATAVEARALLAERGLNVCVIDARFAKPVDERSIVRELKRAPVVMTLEEGTVSGGFGSAVLEAAVARGADTRKLAVLGIPDRFIEHGPRSELFRRIGLDARGVADALERLHRTPVGKSQA